MAAKKVSKKKYLKILNERLHEERDVSFGTFFVFYPRGSKAKHATVVTASEPSSQRELAVMTETQRIAATQFIVTDLGDRLGSGRR